MTMASLVNMITSFSRISSRSEKAHHWGPSLENTGVVRTRHEQKCWNCTPPLRSFSLPFELHRAQRRVLSLGIVEALDGIEHIGLGLALELTRKCASLHAPLLSCDQVLILWFHRYLTSVTSPPS